MARYMFVACLALLAGRALGAVPADTNQRILQFELGLVPEKVVAGKPPKRKPLARRMDRLNVPGVSIAVVHEGRIDWARGYGVTRIGGPAVTADTLFQAGSISKPVFALAVLHQVDAGKLELDADVSGYLKSWKIPDTELLRERKVTLRRLLSHSAGLTVHGFPGYEAGATLPTLTQILDGAPPTNTARIRVDVIPGGVWRYSGGGYTVAQQLLLDVTGVPMPELMRDTVLEPLGMSRSTYEQPLPAARMSEVAMPYQPNGKPVVGGPHVYPEMAAAGLWSTPSDLARYGLGVREALAGKSQIISADTARDMLTPVKGEYGVGPVVRGSGESKHFGHTGGTAGYACLLAMYENGDGVAIMTNGDQGGMLMFEVLRTIAYVYEWPDYGPKMLRPGPSG